MDLKIIKGIFCLVCLCLFFKANAQNADARLLQNINGPVNPGPDKAWRFISDKSYYADAAIPLTMLITGLANHNDSLKVKAYTTAASLVVSTGATFVLKHIINRDRPAIAYPGLIIAKENEDGSSFPSNHTSAAFAAATSLSIACPKWYVIAPSFAYATTVGYSRLYLGVHYPTDVLAGALVGAGSAWLSYKAQQWLTGKKARKAER